MSDDRFKSTAPVSFDEKIELVSLLAEKRGIPRRSAPAISRRTLNHPVPLTSAQERLWFLEQLEPGNPAYHIVRAERLIGDLEVSAFTKSVVEIVRRHEILRTTFASADGHPVQIIRDLEHPLQTPSLTESPRDQATAVRLIDLTNYPEDSRFCEAKKIAETRSKQTFDFVAGPMFRVDLIRLDQTEHLMLFVVHQIVFDWRSHALFSQELSKLYAAFCANRRPELPAIEVQFADFAAWQREQLREDALTSALAYWKNQLEDAPSVLELPYDHVPPPIQRFFGARQAFELSEEVAEQLTDVGRRRGVTLFVVLLTAFKILLQRYSGQDDIVVGCPVTTRELPQTENLIGFFVNTLPLRTDLSDNPTSTQLLSRVQTGFTRALAYQQLPFETLIDELHLPRILNREPLFQVMFIFQDTPLPRLELNGIQSISAPVDTGTSKFDVTLTLALRQRMLAGFFEYRTDLFDQSTTERMVKHFGTVLEGIVADPDRTITALQILTEPELQQLLHEWNDTSADYPKDKCIHQLFEEQVEWTPHKVALEFDGQEITYRELNRRANQLANYLIDVGTGPEKLVGICVERSVEMMVGLLAVLKSGGAYVPLDPGYPKERLRFMVQDAQLSVLLTTQTLVADRELMIEDGDTQFLRRSSGQASSLGPRLKVVCLDRDWPLIVQQKDDNPKQAVTSKNLAYVIYTSGSIGKPKGVQIAHRSVINCLHSLGERLAFTERDVLLAVTTSSFDISVLELFLPLTLGGKVVVASRDEAVDGSELTRRLKDVSATAMQATPSTWRLLIEAGWEGSPRFKVLCGGESMPRDLADALLTRGEVWNLYGPTESTIWSMVHKVDSAEGPVRIGRPIANTKIYILDSHLQPVPIGVHGDLYIGGDGLARGYRNNPELTAERFIPDPFSYDANARLYRTGDRARYHSDRTIEFLGRTDNQVKIRGHRIELSEIESVLMQHSAVNQTVVVAFDQFASDSDNPQSKTGAERSRSIENPKSLAAYVVPAQSSAPSVSELRRFVQEKLPDYMVPASFVFLNALPLSANGKLDRNALPPPDGARPLLDQGFVEPRTEIEELVAQIWCEVLRRDKISLYDNFFDLGGHSLLATRVVARLQSTFHVDLALRKLFELPTVNGLAQHIDELRHRGAGTVIAPVVPVPRTQPLPLSFSQRRLWYLQKVDANLSAYNIPACFRIKGALDVGALERALNALIARHEVFRSAILDRSGEPQQEIVPTLQFDLPALDLSNLPYEQAETEAKRLAGDDARRLHVLDKPPLMRATLVKLTDADHVFILNFHHSIADGSSLAIFYRELSSLYSSALEIKAAALPQLPVQYGDYAVWQRKWVESDAFAAQIAYWKRQLAGLPAQIEFPTNFDRPAVPAYRGARLTKTLSEELTESLRTFSRKQGATTFMTLFATFNILLSRISGQDDIIIGSTIAGRNHPETDGLIGFFINALPLRINLSGNPKFTTLLHHVREVCLDAYTNQEMPFEKIVEELKPPRHRGRNPLFDILFNIADNAERILALPGCEVTKFSHGEPGAKFDVVLQAPEVDGKIELVIVYNADLFRESRIDLLLEQFAFLLKQLINNPEQAVTCQ